MACTVYKSNRLSIINLTQLSFVLFFFFKCQMQGETCDKYNVQISTQTQPVTGQSLVQQPDICQFASQITSQKYEDIYKKV